MTTLTPRLRLAADYLDSHGWTQGTERDSEGHVCLTGAIRYCSPVDGDFYLIREVMRAKGHAERWNDESGRTAEEVLTYLRTAEVTDADLEATFGPQWAAVVVVVRRAARLTTGESISLRAAWDAARDAAGDAVWDAARDAVRDAAGDAVWDAAGDAVRGAARDAAGAAAWDAAWAVATHDLIGTAGYTQAHYDLLMEPWLEVCGDPFEVTA